MTTKIEINYHLPQHCCGKCDFAFNNTYGDVCCKLLPCTDIVDYYGGICDMYKDVDAVIVPEQLIDEIVVEEDEVKGDCNNCKHSFFDAEHAPRCGVDNELILTIGTCAAWEKGV